MPDTIDTLRAALVNMRAQRDNAVLLADELRAQRNAAHDQLADIAALAGGLMDPDERGGGAPVLGEAWRAVCALVKERDTLRAAAEQPKALATPPAG